MDEQRFALFTRLIAAFDEGYDYTQAYDSVPHKYGEEQLYQSEMHLLKAVGQFSDITVTQVAAHLKKSKSACSQMVRKLCHKGLLKQERNPDNHRELRLTLTERGWEIFQLHTRFERKCLQRSCRYLDNFSDKELEIYIQVQQRLNEAFQKDVEDNQELYERVIGLEE